MLAYIRYSGKEISIQEDIASVAKEALEIYNTLGAGNDVKNLQEILRNQVQ